MRKNWKSLFVKEEETINEENEPPSSLTFPTGNVQPQIFPKPADAAANPAVAEVVRIYESGLESINMPGYDFFEFYSAVTSINSQTEQTYQIAFGMAKSLDRNVSASKLLSDAEFYISKINEVHSQYVSQGQQKMDQLQSQKNADRAGLQSGIDAGEQRIRQLREELQLLEASLTENRNKLKQVDEQYLPNEKSIREKLAANDIARNLSIEKLNRVRDGIRSFIKA